MTAQSHLRKFPHARSSTLADLEKRQQTTEQLRRELAQSKPRPWWMFWRKR
jgi:hypothetical protein